jgi:hypothetical protein
MSRYSILLERFQDGEETPAEAEELAALVREDRDRAAALYDAVMLEADLYDSYAAVARIQGARPGRGSWSSPALILIWSAAVFLFVGIAVLLILGRPPASQIAPAAPRTPPANAPEPPTQRPPKPETRPTVPLRGEHEEREEREERDEHRSKRDEIEREFKKGMSEVERKRAQGKFGEANEKLREIEAERDKQLRRLESQGRDR